jgi:uncharacterized protein (DUF1697 family)
MTVRYVSLLRGINVGGHNLIPMARLRAIYESAGCEDVTTYLQSGNVVYRRTLAPGRVAAEVEAAINAEFGFDIRILGRTHAALQRIVAADPFPDAEPARRLVLFLESAPAPAVAKELGRVTSGRDEAILIGKEFHLDCPDGLGTTKLIGLLSDRRLGVAATGRNWRTVTRLFELSGGQS